MNPVIERTYSPQYLRCYCGRFVSQIVRRGNGWSFRDYGTCKVHGEVEIIADGDMFPDRGM